MTFMWPLAQDRHEAPPGRPQCPQGRRKVKRAEAPANRPGSAALPCSELLQPHHPIAECLLHTQPLLMALLSQAPGLAPARAGRERTLRPPPHTCLPSQGSHTCPPGGACTTVPLLTPPPKPTDLCPTGQPSPCLVSPGAWGPRPRVWGGSSQASVDNQERASL